MKQALYCKRKSKKTVELLGCEIEYFILWMRYQFEEDMTIENFGEICSFDHVIPCASFKLDDLEDQLKCFNWTNIRPCIKSENCSKGAKIIPSLIYEQCEKVQNFLNHVFLVKILNE